MVVPAKPPCEVLRFYFYPIEDELEGHTHIVKCGVALTNEQVLEIQDALYAYDEDVFSYEDVISDVMSKFPYPYELMTPTRTFYI